MSSVIIVGGGASGLMAACAALDCGHTVTLFNKHKQLGKKLLITGKGRCNVTNNCSFDEFFENIPNNSRFLYSAFSNFSNYDTMDFFESGGTPLKTERGNRVFPVSDKSFDILAVFEKKLKNKVNFIYKEVTALILEDGVCIGVKANDEKYYADNVIVATGGLSYPNTGSTGDGYRFAKSVGHTVTTLSPSLSALISNDKYCADLMGLSLKNVSVTLFENDKKIYTDFGEMIFTHFGVSGPIILSASAHIKDFKKYSYRISIDLKPALDSSKLDERILRDFSENLNKDFSNSLNKLLPSKMIPVIIKLSEIPPNTKVNSVMKVQRENLLNLIKNFPVSLCDFRTIDEAIITRGGISVKEINPKTMESKICPHLFFVGEVLDLDAYTGGFNLQIAFSTGVTAAKSLY